MNPEARITRYYATNKAKSSWIDIATVETEEGSFEMPYEVAQKTFGISLQIGEEKTFRVSPWSEIPDTEASLAR